MSKPPAYGTKTDVYGEEIESLISSGVPSLEASARIAEKYEISEGTARASLYRYRRRQGQPSGRPTGNHTAPADLTELLAELQRTQRHLDRIVKEIVAWGRDEDERVQQRALRLIQDAAKK